MKLTKLLTVLVTLLLCSTVCVVLSPRAQKTPVTTRRKPVSSGKCNINTATVDQLALLPGIGTRTAQAIIDYREQHGPFKTVSDLTKVRGIGEKTLEVLRQHILV
jgi:competence protein ComEA